MFPQFYPECCLSIFEKSRDPSPIRNLIKLGLCRRHRRQDCKICGIAVAVADPTYVYEETGDNPFQPNDLQLDPQLGGYATTIYNVPGLTSDGDTNFFSRFPQFIFGVHPDYERKANGILPYNYFANLNVTYFSEVEWILATPAPSYLPLGPGGCDGRTLAQREDYNGREFLNRLVRRTHRRRVWGKLKGNHYIGANFI